MLGDDKFHLNRLTKRAKRKWPYFFYNQNSEPGCIPAPPDPHRLSSPSSLVGSDSALPPRGSSLPLETQQKLLHPLETVSWPQSPAGGGGQLHPFLFTLPPAASLRAAPPLSRDAQTERGVNIISRLSSTPLSKLPPITMSSLTGARELVRRARGNWKMRVSGLRRNALSACARRRRPHESGGDGGV